jgi:hypothetical protein
VKVHFVLFAFANGCRRTKVPLLPDDISPSARSLGQPAQHELLGSGNFFFPEYQPNELNGWSVCEQQPNRLYPTTVGPPTALPLLEQGSFHGKGIGFRTNFNPSCLLQIKPVMFRPIVGTR